MLCFYRNLRAGIILFGYRRCLILNLRKQRTCLLHFSQVDCRPFSLCPSPFAMTRNIRFTQGLSLKGHTLCESFNDGTTAFVVEMVFCAFVNF